MMQSILHLIPFALVFPLCLAIPLSETTDRTPHTLETRNLHRRCGPVAEFYNQKQSDWNANGLNEWLDNWWTNHTSDITANSKGFAGAFGRWAFGNPDWSCRDDGSDSDCDFNPCDDNILNSKGPELRQAYYTLEAVNRLHGYFQGLGEAFQSASIASALSKDSWATTFYKDKDVKSVTALKEALNAVTTVVGVAAAFGGLAGPATGAATGAVSALFAGASGAVAPLLGNHQDDTFQKSADMGAILGKVVLQSLKSFVAANNVLMHGDNFQNTGDIRAYLKDGLFLDFGGIDKVHVIDSVNAFLTGQAINALWRTQKVFIMGGGACGDGQGIGEGPQAYSLCRDGKAWYLYWWEEPGGIILNKHKYGWTSAPLGADKLGVGDYAGINVQAVISSSLDAYAAGRFAYTPATASARAQDALLKGWGNPGAAGAAWEGVFTIPVCDVGWAVEGNIDDKQYILQPQGHDYRPHWCGPVCGGDVQLTRDFIAAANMANFQSPRHKVLNPILRDPYILYPWFVDLPNLLCPNTYGISVPALDESKLFSLVEPARKHGTLPVKSGGTTLYIGKLLLLGVLTIGPWALLIVYDLLLWIFRSVLYFIPFVGGRARGKRRPRAPSLSERPSGRPRTFSIGGTQFTGVENGERDGLKERVFDTRMEEDPVGMSGRD
ncbi:MAG: hypothetical protein Q9219_001909 [cf. Caloplaca sp. 3 TL-2023]